MIKINLLPTRPRKMIAVALPALPWLGIVFLVLGVLVVVGIGGYWYMLDGEATRLAAEKTRLETELKALEAAIAKGKAFRQKAADLEKRVAAMDLIGQNRARPVHLLDTLADMIPRELWLASVEEKQDKDPEKGRQLRLVGIAYSPIALADFMSNLRGSGKFKDVDLIVSRQDLTKTPRLVTFEVICTFAL